MRVLIIKMSSMGDIIHTLPALTDAGNAIKDIHFDWVAEENFREIPLWHPLVKNVIPIALRRWRKQLFSTETRREWREFKSKIRENNYDLIIDAQGLLKSALVSRLVKGTHIGLDYHSAREPFASLFYQRKISVAKKQHAVTRLRQLFSQAFGYVLPENAPDYGVDREKFRAVTNMQNNDLVFLHGTTWPTKHWPEEYWITLATLAAEQGYRIKLPWGNAAEQARAMRIAAVCQAAEVLPKSSLKEMACILASAKAVIAVDTGLCHLAAALDVPTISLYGPTDSTLTGALGRSQIHLQANFPCSPCFSRECTYQQAATYAVQPPCFTTLSPAMVMSRLQSCS